MVKILFHERDVNSRKKILKIIKKKEIARIVDNPKERREVISLVRERAGGGITKKEAREILGKFHYNQHDSLNIKETAGLARAIGISGVHKYTKPKENRAAEIIRKSANARHEADTSNNISPKNNFKAGGFSRMSPLH